MLPEKIARLQKLEGRVKESTLQKAAQECYVQVSYIESVLSVDDDTYSERVVTAVERIIEQEETATHSVLDVPYIETEEEVAHG